MNAAEFGWIELVLFYGIAVGFGLWQWIKMDRMLKQTRAEKAAKEAAERVGSTPSDSAPAPAPDTGASGPTG